MEHCFDIAHLGHDDMYTDRYVESLHFFTHETLRARGTPPVKKEQ